MSKIKIVHIITGFNQGGAETALYRLISNLTPLKYEITVISLTGPGFYSDKILELNLPIYYLRMNKFNCIAKLFILAGILKKIKPDIVHTWMYHANLLGGLATKLKKKKKIIGFAIMVICLNFLRDLF
ncbi:MAG: glycosyltransferase [Gammaproteobacteria bacterium]|nr:glycosyltransferase [Gammaproteobacteria bacterium]